MGMQQGGYISGGFDDDEWAGRVGGTPGAEGGGGGGDEVFGRQKVSPDGKKDVGQGVDLRMISRDDMWVGFREWGDLEKGGICIGETGIGSCS